MSSTDHYTPSDPRIQPIHPSKYPWVPIPSPASDDAIVKVSMIPTSRIRGARKILTTFREEDESEETEIPCWSFLVEKGEEGILWDMGLRDDPQNLPDKIKEGALKEFHPIPGPGPIERLIERGYDAKKIKTVIFSHSHFDHYGDLNTLPQPAPSILVGPSSLTSKTADSNADWPKEWLDKFNFVQLPDTSEKGVWTGEVATLGNGRSAERKWEAVGCFEAGVDWFGDGSFWVLDAPGHSAGHIEALCRVTIDPPTYILLGGDSSHHQNLYLPAPSPTYPTDPRSPNPVIDGQPTLAINPPQATWTIGQLTRMSIEDNVMVVLAHEGEVEGVLDEWPGDLGGWKEKGWKEEKAKEVEEAAKKRLGVQ